MDFFKRKRAILLAVAIGTFMSALDSSVVNMVLPNIRAYFQTSLSAIEWTVISYLLVISSLLLTYGRLGDLYGHKKIYLLGFIIFTAGSFLCALSPSVLVLIIFRGFQAVGAGMLMAMGPAIVTDAVPPQERGRALSITAVSVASALTMRPGARAALTSAFGWQSIFLIDMPIGILGFFLANRTFPANNDRTAQSFDFIGAGLIFLTLVSILLPLSLVEKYGWNNPLILISIAAGMMLTAGFVLWEKRTGIRSLRSPFFGTGFSP